MISDKEMDNEIDMRATLVKFSKRKNFFGTLAAEWETLFQGRCLDDEDKEIDALFDDDEKKQPSPKKRRALELSSSFSGSTSNAPTDKVASLHAHTKQAEKDIALSQYYNENASSTQKRTKTCPSKVERINKWYQQVLKHGQSGSVGLVPDAWQSKFPVPASSKLQLLKDTTLSVLEHYDQWIEKQKH